jgi:hypothetical protein
MMRLLPTRWVAAKPTRVGTLAPDGVGWQIKLIAFFLICAKNNYYYVLATEFVLNPPPTLPAHHTGIANSGSNGHYFTPDSSVANYNPQAESAWPTVAPNAWWPVQPLHLQPLYLQQLRCGMSYLTSPIPSLAWDRLPTKTAQSSSREQQSQSTTQMAI